MFCVPMSQNIKENLLQVYPVLWGMIFLLNYFVSINQFQPFCRMGFGYMDFSNYEHIPYYYFHNITSSFKIYTVVRVLHNTKMIFMQVDNA